jgi:hypothetical protein
VVPDDAAAWKSQREAWLHGLREKSFRGWPSDSGALDLQEVFAVEREGIRLAAYDFTSQGAIRLRLYLAHRAGSKRDDLELVVLNALDDEGWQKWLAAWQPGFADELKGETLPAPDAAEFDSLKKMFESFKWGMAYVAPRGIGPTAWDQSPKKQTQIRRRFMLLGQTLPGMQVWDVRRAAQALRTVSGMQKVPLWMQGERDMATIALYAAVFEPDVARVDLWWLPASHRDGPDFLNVLRVLDLPQTVALAAERTKIRLYQKDAAGWDFPTAVASKLGWDAKQIQIRQIKTAAAP